METVARTTTWAVMGAEAMTALYDLRWMIVFIVALILCDFWWGISEDCCCKSFINLNSWMWCFCICRFCCVSAHRRTPWTRHL